MLPLTGGCARFTIASATLSVNRLLQCRPCPQGLRAPGARGSLSKWTSVMLPVLFPDFFVFPATVCHDFLEDGPTETPPVYLQEGPSRRLSWTQFVKMVRIDSRRSLVNDFKLLLSRLGLPHDPLVPSRCPSHQMVGSAHARRRSVRFLPIYGAAVSGIHAKRQCGVTRARCKFQTSEPWQWYSSSTSRRAGTPLQRVFF